MLAVSSEDRRILEVGESGNQPYADLWVTRSTARRS
jgi:hypothetical protein